MPNVYNKIGEHIDVFHIPGADIIILRSHDTVTCSEIGLSHDQTANLIVMLADAIGYGVALTPPVAHAARQAPLVPLSGKIIPFRPGTPERDADRYNRPAI